jgi:hypothetical protein
LPDSQSGGERLSQLNEFVLERLSTVRCCVSFCGRPVAVRCGPMSCVVRSAAVIARIRAVARGKIAIAASHEPVGRTRISVLVLAACCPIAFRAVHVTGESGVIATVGRFVVRLSESVAIGCQLVVLLGKSAQLRRRQVGVSSKTFAFCQVRFGRSEAGLPRSSSSVSNTTTRR